MSIAPIIWLSTAAATAIGVVRSIRVRRYWIDSALYQTVVQKLLARRELERMKKLAESAKPAVFAVALDAADQSLLERPPKTPFPIASAEAKEAFQRAYGAELARFRPAPLVDLVVLALGAGAAMWGRLHGAGRGWTDVLAAASLLLLLDGFWKRKKIRSVRPASVGELIDLMTRARLEPDDPYRTRPPEPLALDKPTPQGIWFRVMRDGVEVQRVTAPGAILKIGRQESAHLVLDDPGVSRLHAVAEISGDEVTLVDLGSDKGTFVDGKKVNKARVAPGARIGIGPFEIVVERGAAPPPAAEPAPTAEPKVNLERTCDACGSRGFVPLTDAPPSVVPPGYRAETCKNCGKVELFKTS